jgi:hypothetical protein
MPLSHRVLIILEVVPLITLLLCHQPLLLYYRTHLE